MKTAAMPSDLQATIKQLEEMQKQSAENVRKYWDTNPEAAKIWAGLHAGIFATLKTAVKL